MGGRGGGRGLERYTPLMLALKELSSPNTVFLRSDAAAAIFLLLIFVQLLFEGSVYSFEKPAVINNL